MTTQPDYETITIHTLPNILGSEGKQIMKFGRLIEYNKIKIFFFKNKAENEAGRLVPNLFLFFLRNLYMG